MAVGEREKGFKSVRFLESLDAAVIGTTLREGGGVGGRRTRAAEATPDGSPLVLRRRKS